eukprot:GHVL01027541.1.p2 GENE.GHVL01027541.1~~GHVL01027541.1.p2  ORF type:complete len:127 (+),score=8.76 GHVL01027541.1:430-810(+)
MPWRCLLHLGLSWSTPRQYGTRTPRRTSTSWRPSRDELPDSSATATTTRQVSAGCWTPLGGSLWRSAGSLPAYRCSTRSRTASSTVRASSRSWPPYHHASEEAIASSSASSPAALSIGVPLFYPAQ